MRLHCALNGMRTPAPLERWERQKSYRERDRPRPDRRAAAAIGYPMAKRELGRAHHRKHDPMGPLQSFTDRRQGERRLRNRDHRDQCQLSLHEWIDDPELLLDQLSVLKVFGKEDCAVGSQRGCHDD